MAIPNYQGQKDYSKDLLIKILVLGYIKFEMPVRRVNGAVERQMDIQVWGSGQSLGLVI